MAGKRRDTVVFSLAFLDIMSCGFGAIILFFVIINHATEKRADDLTADVNGEVRLLDTSVKLEQLNLTQVRNSLAEIEEEIVIAHGRSDRLIDDLDTRREELSRQDNESLSRREHVNQLMTEIKSIDEELSEVQKATEQGGDDIRNFYGDGDRQYLTGLRVGGKHILILLDSSASMLDPSIVNIIRRRNLPLGAEDPGGEMAERSDDCGLVDHQDPGGLQVSDLFFQCTGPGSDQGNRWSVAGA